MSRFIEVARESDLTDGAMKEVIIEDHEILLAKVASRYYAIASRCPHMGAKLSQGRLEGAFVTCPRHGSRFDITDGHVIEWTADLPSVVSTLGKAFKRPRAVATYKTKVEENKIFVEI